MFRLVYHTEKISGLFFVPSSLLDFINFVHVGPHVNIENAQLSAPIISAYRVRYTKYFRLSNASRLLKLLVYTHISTSHQFSRKGSYRLIF